MKKFLLPLVATIVLMACRDNKPESVTTNSVPQLSFQILRSLPHDTLSFTEGLFFNDGRLFEGTGAPQNLPFTKSELGIVDTLSGKFNAKATLDRNIYFGEGIIQLNNKIYQLTYQNQVGFIYDAQNFKQIGTFNYANKEGWGLTTDGKSLIMSDGTNVVTYLDSADLQPVKSIKVTENGYDLSAINELEYVDRFIYANVWQTNYIVKIDPANGNVVGKMDFSDWANDAKRLYAGAAEMNGITYNPATKQFWITGKLWPKIYVVQL